MKFTKLIAASFAALAMFSCSKEVVDTDNGLVRNPGDVQFSFKVGNGTTTYATETEEKLIHKIEAFVFEKGGPQNGMRVSSVTTPSTYMPGSASVSPTVTIAAADVTGAGIATVEIYLVANTTLTNITKKSDLINAMITDNLNVLKGSTFELANGIPAIISAGTFTMQEGGSTDGVKDLVMLKSLARVFISHNGNIATEDIKDYEVDFTGMANGVVANTILGTGNYTGVTYGGTWSYTVAGNGAGQFNGGEAVAYLYPSNQQVTITVKDLAGITKEVKFIPQANKNYNINVVTELVEEENKDHKHAFSGITINEWGAGDKVYDANFTGFPFNESYVFPDGFSVENGKLVIDVTLADPKIMDYTGQGVFVDGAELFGEGVVIPDDVIMSADGQFAVKDTYSLSFFALPNKDSDKTYTVTVEGVSSKKYTFKVVVKGMNLPKNFTTTFNGIEVTSVHYPNMVNGYMGAVNLVKDVNAAYPTGNFQENLSLYMLNNLAFAADYCKNGVANTGRANFGTKPQFKCPAGFRFFSGMNEIQTFFGLTSFSLTAADVVIPVGVATIINPGASVTSMYTEYGTNQHEKHHILSDGKGGKLAIIGNENFVDVYATTPSRLIFWDKTVQQKQALTNNYIRCVKDTNIPVSFK